MKDSLKLTTQAIKRYVDKTIEENRFSGDYNDLENRPCYDDIKSIECTYDGNATGRVIATEPLEAMVKVSDEVIDYETYLKSVVGIHYPDGIRYHNMSDKIESEDYFLTKNKKIIWGGDVTVVYEDNASVMGAVFPEKGIYFHDASLLIGYGDPSYTCSFIAEIGGELKQLDEKFIPDTIATKDSVFELLPAYDTRNTITITYEYDKIEEGKVTAYGYWNDGRVTQRLVKVADLTAEEFDLYAEKMKSAYKSESYFTQELEQTIGDNVYNSTYEGDSFAVYKDENENVVDTILYANACVYFIKQPYSNSSTVESIEFPEAGVYFETYDEWGDSRYPIKMTINIVDGELKVIDRKYLVNSPGRTFEPYSIEYYDSEINTTFTYRGGEVFNDESNIALEYDSHAEGKETKALGNYSHTEGYKTLASGQGSHAEGYGTKARGKYSHAEGWSSQALAQAAHAEGEWTRANGTASHAEGYGAIALGYGQHAQGKYNIEDEYTYAHIVGNGSYEARSNAHTLDWKGNAWFAGDVFVKGTSQKDAEKLATEEFVNDAIDNIPEGFSGDYNDLDNRPCYDNREFETVQILCDGNFEGKETLDNMYFAHFAKIADLNDNDIDSILSNGLKAIIKIYQHNENDELVLIEDLVSYSLQPVGGYDGLYSTKNNEYVLIATKDITEPISITKGLWVYNGNVDENTLVCTYDISYDRRLSGELKQLDGQLLPEGLPYDTREFEEVKLAIDGNFDITGKETAIWQVEEIENEETVTYSMMFAKLYDSDFDVQKVVHEGLIEFYGMTYPAYDYCRQVEEFYSIFDQFIIAEKDGAIFTKGIWGLYSVDGEINYNPDEDELISLIFKTLKNGKLRIMDSKFIPYKPGLVIEEGTEVTPWIWYINEKNGVYATGDEEFSIGKGAEIFNDYCADINDYTSTLVSKNIAIGDYSHAEGCASYAKGYCSHTEGYNTYAAKDCTHAEGRFCQAVGECSHAEGSLTQALGKNQHVQGILNIPDPDNKYVHIVGNGTLEDEENLDGITFSNAHTLDWNGNAWFAGDVYIGPNNEVLVTKAYVDEAIANASLGNGSDVSDSGVIEDSEFDDLISGTFGPEYIDRDE
jgi:hypothetical protein